MTSHLTHGITVSASKKHIAKVLGLSTTGRHWYRTSNQNVKRLDFPVTLVTNANESVKGICLKSLPQEWKEIATVIIKYFTLEDRFSLVYGYHVEFLLYVKDCKNEKFKINVPYYLKKAMQTMAKKVKDGTTSALAHHGLIKLLIVDTLKENPGVTWNRMVSAACVLSED